MISLLPVWFHAVWRRRWRVRAAPPASRVANRIMAHSVRVGMVAATGAPGAMVSESVAELLLGLGSGTEELTVTVLLRVPVAEADRRAVKVKLPVAPEARDGLVQLIVPFRPTAGVEQVQPEATVELT